MDVYVLCLFSTHLNKNLLLCALSIIRHRNGMSCLVSYDCAGWDSDSIGEIINYISGEVYLFVNTIFQIVG